MKGLTTETGQETEGIRAGVIVDALMIEYQNIHQRVLNQLELYETTNTRILALIGVLFYYGLTYFQEINDAYIHVIVNLVFIVVIPFIAVASVAFAAANLIKIMIWGDFLKTIENKVNTVLKPEARFLGFDREQVLSWEYWRVAYGYAGKSNFFSVVTFSGFLVLAFIVAAVASLWLRLEFILERCAASYGLYRGVAILMASIFVCVTWLSFALFAKQRSKSLEGVYDDGKI
ncbi:MAG: hypothetical protein ACOX4K_09470 [Bacillota bacterium]|jgi:hypothetical protein